MFRAAHPRPPALSPTSPASRLAPALAAGLLWLAAGLSAGYWVLQVWGRSPFTPVAAVVTPATNADPSAVARALGAAPPEQAQPAVVSAAAASRWRLLGLVVRPGQRGAALLALDDQPPRPYTVGAALDGGLYLLSVDRAGARLGASPQGPVTLDLKLPPAD
jgi:general secretion pathway protein C